MADTFTYLVYISLLFLTVSFAAIGIQNSNGAITVDKKSYGLRINHFIAIIMIGIIAGFRYKVGVDWYGYRDYFYFVNNQAIGFFDQKNELGFYFINKIIGGLDMGYGWMFFTVALISWYCFFKSIHKVFLPLFIYFLFVDEYFFWSLNGVRQFAAIGFYLLSLKFLINRNWKFYLLYIFLASLFHSSVLVLLPLYLLPYDKLYSRKIWLIIFAISLLFLNNNPLFNYVEGALLYLGSKFSFLEKYLSYEGSELLTSKDVTLGFGVYFRLLVNAFLIFFSSSVVARFPKMKFYFLLFFIGAIVFNLFMGSLLVGRYNHYFMILRSFVLAITIYHLWSRPNFKLPIVFFILCYFALFLKAIDGGSNMCAPYNFIP